ncbi:polysaccharide biosynthesis/export family protein [Pararhizobium mangrovi]|uniref:Polysaccharide export protein n=1 Tax=Pararhizobium mangrovi TaxID=2590452 RepID=A0A506TYU7_9HYPH|nr:polysaccharide biosynthesis/export family protein [Pararhizobium mangrovi]TPW26161.1 polysaccharide export protein [Pararhizobium mangrovi]
MLYSRFRRLCVAALACAPLVACQSEKPPLDPFPTGSVQPYHLDSGDQVRVTVFDQSGLTGTYNVDPAGYISVPLIGAVPARGKTLANLERTIAGKLANGYVRDPDVSVQMDRYRSIFIMGEVSQGGQYSYVPGMTAQQAVAAAGGFSARAYEKTVEVTRRLNGKSLTGRILPTEPIRPGDTITVRERLF